MISERGIKALQVGGPFLAFFIFIGMIWVLAGWDMFVLLTTLLIAYEFPPAGKETIIPAGILVWDINWVVISLSVAFMDIVTAIFLVWNLDHARKIPFLGPWIERFEESNADVLERKRLLKGAAFVGLILFVIIPFQGSGGVGGSIMGRITGFKPWTAFLAIAIGAVTGTLAIGYITVTVGTAMFAALKTTQAKVVVFLIFAAVITTFGLILHHYKKRKKANMATRVKDDEE